jgi:YggT family protein
MQGGAMFVFGNIILGIAKVLDIALSVYMWVIIIRALISWVNPDPYNPIVQFLTRVTEPALRPIRKLVPPYKIGIDLSPLVAILVIIFLQYAVVDTLKRIGYAMG